jgi:hypothetical protein
MSQDLYEHGLVELDLLKRIRFPSTKYQKDPVGFFRDILGVEPYASGDWGEWNRSVELIEAVRDYDRVAVKAGRKVSKSWTIAGIALWFYCSFPEARVIMTSTTAQQVERVLWLEISRLYSRSGKCVECKLKDPNGTQIAKPCPHSTQVDGDLGQLPHTGLKVKDVDRGDFREIFGFTSKQGEAVQGMSGTRMLYIIDEASGIPDFIYDAIEGNRAGGAKVILTGNPTQNSGEFYDAFHSKKLDEKNPESTGYKCITISSEESPNVLAGRKIIPGLAERTFIREREMEWGRESPLFIVHVLGEFAKHEEGCAFSLHAIKEAEDRWSETRGAGRLCIGLDPAGASGEGDDTVFTVRRGLKVSEPIVKLGLDEEAIRAELLRIIDSNKIGREVPIVTMDRTGSVGAIVYGTLSAHLDTCERNKTPPPYELVGLRMQDKAQRQPGIYHSVRDELCASLEEMFRMGLAIYTDLKLEAELHVLTWTQHPSSGLYSITPKKEIKKKIKRSPDRCDSLQLACWDEESLMRSVGVSGAYAAPKVGATQTQTEVKPDSTESEWDRIEMGGRAEDYMDPYARY